MKVSHNANPMRQRYYRFKRFRAHWPAWLALVIILMLYEALPKIFYLGPRGLMAGLVITLIILLIITQWRNNLHIHRVLSLTINVLITVYMIISVSRLVQAVLQGHIGPVHLLSSALTLWVTNVLLFALWYWNLDGGGPAKRELKDEQNMSAFLFPQTQITLCTTKLTDSIKNWEPHFIDYLFLSFNTSTAFSPTDTPVLNRWAKCMGMIQAMISLTIIVIFASRAIGILSPNASYLVS